MVLGTVDKTGYGFGEDYMIIPVLETLKKNNCIEKGKEALDAWKVRSLFNGSK